MNRWYILKGREVVPAKTFLAAGIALEKLNGDRVVAQTKVGEVLVSTVFLGLDHRWGG